MSHQIHDLQDIPNKTKKGSILEGQQFSSARPWRLTLTNTHRCSGDRHFPLPFHSVSGGGKRFNRAPLSTESQMLTSPQRNPLNRNHSVKKSKLVKVSKINHHKHLTISPGSPQLSLLIHCCKHQRIHCPVWDITTSLTRSHHKTSPQLQSSVAQST